MDSVSTFTQRFKRSSQYFLLQVKLALAKGSVNEKAGKRSEE
jgi:hypothetical protein